MSDQGLSIFDEEPGGGSPDDKTQVIPVAGGAGKPTTPAAQADPAPTASRPVVPPARAAAPEAPAVGTASFPVVRRGGYDTGAVDARVHQLLTEKSGLSTSLTESERRVVELEAELEKARTDLAEMERPSYAGLGGRASAMLRLA